MLNPRHFNLGEKIQKQYANLPNSIQYGETTSWRMWLLNTPICGNGYQLRSLVRTEIWYPGMVMKGKPNNSGDYGKMQGIYSYKTYKGCIVSGGVRHYKKDCNIVVGEVEIWGDVVEHMLGYRSQFARIKSIDEVFLRDYERSMGFVKKDILNKLREKYFEDR